MDAEIDEALRSVYAYAHDQTSWIVVKKELLRALPARFRTLFSTRHPVTKRHEMNDFERAIVDAWVALGGARLILMP